MKDRTLPDYGGGSIVNLMSSLVNALGGRNAYAPLRGLDLAALSPERHVVLLVVDGLGDGHLRASPTAPTLNRHREQRITSVFPTTTASAITTFMTGLAPQHHALVGWFLYFKEIGCVASPLPFRPRIGGGLLSEAGIMPTDLFDHRSAFDSLEAKVYSVPPERIAHTPFNAHHCGRAVTRPYASLPAMFETIARTLRQARERSYVYAYYPEIDALGHQFGIGSEEVAAHLGELDRTFDRFLGEIAGTGTTVLVTADHGFVDPPPDRRLDLAAHPELTSALLLPPCGEPRVAYCYVSRGRTAAFERYVEHALGDWVELIPSHDLIRQGYFGPGDPHPRLWDRVGDYALIARGDAMITSTLPGEAPYELRGVHGGLSEAEMYVPLCIVRA